MVLNLQAVAQGCRILQAKRCLPATLQKHMLQTVRYMSQKKTLNDTSLEELTSMTTNLRDHTPESYHILRNIILAYQRNAVLGENMDLTPKEQLANEVIMCAKKTEYEKAILDPTKYLPGQHFFQVLPQIKISQLFKILQKMPKGGVLHAHDTALCSTDFLIQLTYREYLWICTTDNGCKAVGFRFSEKRPTIKAIEDCCWEPMCEFRERRGDENVRKYLYRCFSMYPLSTFESNNQAWQHFMGIFILLDGLLLYAPVWADYYYNALTEFYADGVQYLELRSLLPQLYCLNGALLEIRDTVQIYKQETERFMGNNPGFIGAKLIYAPLRGVEPSVVAEYVKTCTALHQEFPTFVKGFDLVGQEELGRPLSEFIDQLLTMPKEIDFFFHAGETNWYGSEIDENLIDAVLLGAKRIGHGFAITKHPLLMRLAKQLDIAIEVCPVSNQVLQLGQDFNSHPAATLISQNVPIVISSDDPSFWRAAPLSHDFFVAFLGIAPMCADLKFLKHLAKNSLKYSALTEQEKANAMQKWEKQWDKWVESLIAKK